MGTTHGAAFGGLAQREKESQTKRSTERIFTSHAGEFRVLIDRVMPLYEAAAAHRLVAQNTTLGKIVLDPTLS